MSLASLLVWCRAKDGDGIFAERDVYHADVYKRASVASNRSWFWEVYGSHGVLLKSGSSHRQAYAKASAASVILAKIRNDRDRAEGTET